MNGYCDGVDNSAYLAHYGVLGMKWGQYIMAKYKTSSSNRKAKRAQRKADIAEGKKYSTYSFNENHKLSKRIASSVSGGAALGVWSSIASAIGKTMAADVSSMTGTAIGRAALASLNPVALGVGVGAAVAAYGIYESTKATNNKYADVGAVARRGANYATDNMQYAKQVQDAADKYDIAARVKRVN